jgi:hypothetical protein
MTSQQSQTEDPHQRTLLLREVVELLRWELSALSNGKWEDLPELKKKKVVLACRLREIDWTPSPRPVDWLLLKSQIADLENQSRKKIENHLALIDNQVLALQEQHQYWRECLNVSFRKFYESP